MCGIIAGISTSSILPYLVSGLEKLEYRGYDSAGLALLGKNKISLIKTVGKVAALKKELPQKDESLIGIGHTRWATHGVPSTVNAHPHVTEKVAVVHNGIIENYQILKQELQAHGYQFYSETDTEVITNLLDFYLSSNIEAEIAAKQVIARLEGSFSVVFMFRDNELLFAATEKTPLVLGLSKSGTYIASDVIAFSNKIENVVYLEDGDRVIIRTNSYKILDKKNQPIERKLSISYLSEEVSKKDYPHFMLKEIHEQATVLSNAIERYIRSNELLNLDIEWQSINRIRILACGSAYYSGLVAKYWLETMTNISVDLEIASEYRYRKSVTTKNTVTIIISQSGETLDTLEALKKAKAAGEIIISVINVERSAIARASDYVLPIMVGAEVGVASTKAFLGQLLVLAILSLKIGVSRGHLTTSTFEELQDLLVKIPEAIKEILTTSDNIKKIATEIKDFDNALFLGRGCLYPIALEGSLKMKELSYIHAEGYAAGELKHGAISLIDNNMLVVSLMPYKELFDKMFANLHEVIARGAKVLCIVSKDDVARINDYTAWTIEVPNCHEFVAPIVYTVPLQLLAYYTAGARGNDIDQPRNLAKSVTVE